MYVGSNQNQMSPLLGSCLYIATRVFIKHAKTDESRQLSISNLEFIATAMLAIGKRHPITKHFSAQLDLDIEAAGIEMPSSFARKHGQSAIRTRIDALLAK